MSVTDFPLNADSLRGKLLLAMPQMNDPRFEQAVMIMLEHNSEGAMGLIINKPLIGVTFPDLMEQLEIKVSTAQTIDCPVLFGGPVEIGRGFIVHSTDYLLPQSLQLGEGVAITTLLEMLDTVALGKGPQNMFFCLGYAGWTPGQLDGEILQNTWLHAPLDAKLLFELPQEAKWEAAMRLAGIDPAFLADEAGHA